MSKVLFRIGARRPVMLDSRLAESLFRRGRGSYAEDVAVAAPAVVTASSIVHSAPEPMPAPVVEAVTEEPAADPVIESFAETAEKVAPAPAVDADAGQADETQPEKPARKKPGPKPGAKKAKQQAQDA